jgi:hypothetical protein
LIFGSIAVSPLFFAVSRAPAGALVFLRQMECQRSKAHAKKENSMQIVLAVEVYWEGKLGNLTSYVTNLRRMFAADGFPSDPLPLLGSLRAAIKLSHKFSESLREPEGRIAK